MTKEERVARLRAFANTYGSGSSKVLNLSVDEQLEFFNAQQTTVSTWLKNIRKKLRELNAQKVVAKMSPEQLAELLDNQNKRGRV